MDFKALREQKTVWYVKVKETEIKHCKVLLTLFFHELFYELMVMPNENGQSVSLFLDEARLLDFDLPYYLSISRKYRISSLLCYQSVSQIQSQFGVNDAKTLLNGGVFSKLILPGLNDPRELALIRDLLGYYLDESGKAKPLLNINQIRTLKDELLLFVGSLPPVKAPMNYFFKQKKFKQVATEYPPQKSITDKPMPDELT